MWAGQPLPPSQPAAQPFGSSDDALPWVQQPHPDAMLPLALRQSFPASEGPSLEPGTGMGQQQPVRLTGILQQLHQLLPQQQQEPKPGSGPEVAAGGQLSMQPQAVAASGRLPIPLEAAVVKAVHVPEPSAVEASSGRLPMQDISNDARPLAIPQHPHHASPMGAASDGGQWRGAVEGGEDRGEDLLGNFLRPDASFASSTGTGDDEDRGVRVNRAEGLQGRDDGPAGLRGSVIVIPGNNAIGGGGISHAGPGSRGSMLVVPASGLSLQLDASAMRELMQQVDSLSCNTMLLFFRDASHGVCFLFPPRLLTPPPCVHPPLCSALSWPPTPPWQP